MEKILSYYLRSLVPLVGDEVFFVKDENGQQSLRSYVVEHFFYDYPDKAERSYSKEERDKMKTDGYYGISVLRNAFKHASDFDFYYSTIVNNAKDRILIHPSVLTYIKTIRPRLILTTSPFNILDELLPEYKTLWFYPTEESNFKDLSAPTVCHIFGKAGKCEVKWVVGEEELLDFLHGWNNGKSLDKAFVARFQEKGLLVLGCDSLPDWIFRFLWYPLGKFSKEKGKGFLLGSKENETYEVEKKTGISKNAKSSIHASMSFEEFLRRINYEKSENMYRLLDAAIEIIQQDEREEYQQTHDFFISYASDDRELALKIKGKLEQAGLNVWLDKERPQELDGRYWAGIDRAIEKSRYFMPVVTKNYVERFFSKRRVKENKVTALEEETEKIISSLLAIYNDDEEKMLSKIIPVLNLGEKVMVFHRNKEIEEDLNTENIDKYSNLGNPCFWIFNQINFKFYSETDIDSNTFDSTDWSIYKEK